MKAAWYGDKRDIVKWSALLHLARTNGLAGILQVAYLRDEKIGASVVVDGMPVDPDTVEEVKGHFRREVRQIVEAGRFRKVSIEVFDDQFKGSEREDYTKRVIRRIQRFKRKPILVFLDPDTGIAGKEPTSAHVTTQEISDIWQALPFGSWLAVYQHARRSGDRFGPQQADFSKAVSGAKVIICKSPDIAKDVVLFAACRQ